MANFLKLVKATTIFATLLLSVNSWKTCSETFCGRLRQSPEGFHRYSLDLTTLIIDDGTVNGSLTSTTTPNSLHFNLLAYYESLFFLRIHPTQNQHHQDLPDGPKFQQQQQPQAKPMKVLEQTDDHVTLENDNGKAVIYASPFKVEFYNSNKLVSVVHAQNRLVYEFGPANQAVGLDVTFPGARRAYGIPLHAEHLSLRSTGPGGPDPYRLFNVDYNRYKINSTESLYGSIPVLYAHGTEHSSGVLWRNPSQTWVDVDTTDPNQVRAFLMSEIGEIDLVMLTGPTLSEAVQQNAQITGPALLQQYFALGYHQSRSSYMNDNDVRTVVEEFDKNDLPLEAVWLDIDYTDNSKYFTWDPIRFSDPIKLQRDLAETHRKLVVVIEPQIKVEEGYFIHDDATARGYYVKNPDGSDFVGEDSSYLDLFNPDAFSYYVLLHFKDTFKGTNLHIWHDMNEPAVFENWEHENTLPGNLVHYGKFQHKQIHNLHGFYQVMATYNAVNQHNQRQFILTRSHFTGIQQYAGIWTGDNYASWDYLQISFPMCLSEALAGVSFCGANVGGFEGIPDDELYQRWYQAGAWLPFYRGHSAMDVPRREPYLYPDDIKSRVRTALNQRYAHLPAWYTAFWQYHRYGDPVIRPLTYHYPREESTLDIDNQILLGTNILTAPILKPNVSSVDVYLPGGASQIWYNIDDGYKVFPGRGYHKLTVDLDSVPVFYRGGGIIPRKDTPRRSTVETRKDPYTIYVCLDLNHRAEGTLFVDDYESWDFVQSKYLYVGLSYKVDTFSVFKIDEDADYDGAAEVGQVKVLNPPKGITRVEMIGDDRKAMEISYSEDGAMLTIDNVHGSLQKAFQIKLYSY